MKVTEHLSLATEPLISFELVPPKRGASLDKLLGVVEELKMHHPPFIDVTSHAAEASYEETPQGVERRIRRKRPGTLGLCAIIQHNYNVDAVPHVLCKGYTKEETEDFLIDLHYSGIRNILALRGDERNYQKPMQNDRSANNYAADLVRQIAALNKGQYLHELLDSIPANFCIGVAGYPEKHPEALSLETDIQHLKAKVDAGAEYIVTQMFFNNDRYFRFVELCQEEEIRVPIIPGIKVLTSQKQLQSIPAAFYTEIPGELSGAIISSPEHAQEIGVEWAAKQVQELLNRKVPAVHFYVMQNAQPVLQVLQKIGA